MQSGKIDLRILLYSCLAIIIVELMSNIILSHALIPALLIIGISRIVEISLLIAIVSRLGENLSALGFESKFFLKKTHQGLLWSTAFACIGGLFLFVLHITNLYPVTNFKASLPDT